MNPLSVKITLLSADEVPEEILARLNGGTGGGTRMDGWIWIRSGERVFRWKDDEAGRSVLQTMTSHSAAPPGTEDPWRILLNGGTPAVHPPDMRDGISRCVILFEAVPDQERILERNDAADLVPIEYGDVLTETDTGKMILIKGVAGHTEEEIQEYAAAVIETVETETGISIQAGIGRPSASLAGMRESMRQAEQALETGRWFHLEGAVFGYGPLFMERLVRMIPEKDGIRMRREMLAPEAEKLMNGEMTETVQAFFRNDLNLSTAARELFIHRNTLIYRLDKIRKLTGFDLRKFQDAAAFRLLYRLPADRESH